MKTIENYIVAIGTSTGGPKALTEVLASLDEQLPATYIVVQHMPPGFTASLAERLNTVTNLQVKEAENGERLQKGTVYIAPGGKQLKVSQGNRLSFRLIDEDPYQGHKPSVNVMLQSLGKIGAYQKLMVVIMTGMGSDGLEGVTYLKQIRDIKVIAQDEATSIVYGMPKSIVQADLADAVVPLEAISQTIKMLMGE